MDRTRTVQKGVANLPIQPPQNQDLPQASKNRPAKGGPKEAHRRREANRHSHQAGGVAVVDGCPGVTGGCSLAAAAGVSTAAEAFRERTPGTPDTQPRIPKPKAKSLVAPTVTSLRSSVRGFSRPARR
jgi:hypothetical protein